MADSKERDTASDFASTFDAEKQSPDGQWVEGDKSYYAPSDPEAAVEKAENAGGAASEQQQTNTNTGTGPADSAAATPAGAGPASASPNRALADGVPDGGLAAWVQVLGAWVIMVDSWGLVNTFGVYQTFYETDLLLGDASGTSTAISWIGSLQAALLTLGGLLSGPLYDMGYLPQLITAGVFLMVFGMFMTSLCTTYWQLLLAQGVTVGLGMGLTFLPSTAVLAQYFRRRRALAVGITSTGSPLAGVVFPILFSHLQPRIGFGWATRIIAFILLAISVIPIAFLRQRVPPAQTPAPAPASAPSPASTSSSSPAPKPPRRVFFDVTALREPHFVLMVLGAFLSFLCLYIPFFFLQLFAERRHISSGGFSPFYLVTMLNVGSIFGRVVPNALADRFGSLKMTVLCSVTSAIMLFGWMGIAATTAHTDVTSGSHHLAGVVVFALLYGGFSGGIVSLIASVIFNMTPNPATLGARMGMTFLFIGFSLLVGPPIAGAILGDGTDSQRWMNTIGYAAAALTLGTLANIGSLYFWRRYQRKQRQ